MKLKKIDVVIDPDLNFYYTMEFYIQEFLLKYGRVNVHIIAIVEEEFRNLQLTEMEAHDLEFIMDWIQDLDIERIERIERLELSYPNSIFTPREQNEDLEFYE